MKLYHKTSHTVFDCVATPGAITDEMIVHYIEHQNEDAEKRGDDFTVLDLTT